LRTFLLGRLLVWLLPIAAVGVALHWHFERKLLTRVFDVQALDRAQALASLVVSEQGALSLDFVVDYMPGYSLDSRAEFFEAWDPDGRVLGRSPSLGDSHLPRNLGSLDEPATFETTNPELGPLRCLGVHFPERIGSAIDGAPLWVDIVVAAPASALSEQLRGGLIEVIATGAISALAIIVAVALTLRRGASAITEAVLAVQAIDPKVIDQPLSLDELPIEIWPLLRELNRHIRATSDAMEQERSFNAFVAHELRTPISEIRTTTEVALQYPDAIDHESALRANHAVTLRMGQTVEALLRLARLQSSDHASPDDPVDLAALLRDRLEAAAGVREMHVTAPESMPVSRGSSTWAIVVENLLSNALVHSPEGAALSIALAMGDAGIEFSVENAAPRLVQADLKHLTQRLWRDPSATRERGHSGLGLAIVAAACRRLGAELAFDLTAGRLRATVKVAPPGGTRSGAGA